MPLHTKHLLSIADLTGDEIRDLVALATLFKERRATAALPGRIIALLFEKPSLRTRVSFQVAMAQLGGQVSYLSRAEVGLGEREPCADVARVLSRFVDGIVVRTFRHETVQEIAAHSTVPVINGLSDFEHPCQVLSDLMTIQEHLGRLSGLRLTYVGDGNNVAHSLLLGTALVGMHMSIACPAGYEPDALVLQRARALAAATGASIQVGQDPARMARGADLLYTDVWTSMGQEVEQEQRKRDFQGYQINQALLDLAAPDALVMHDLPAHRGEEITADVLEGPRSVVFQQAENRLHIAKALLVRLLARSADRDDASVIVPPDHLDREPMS